jgi:hypothetical protein
MRAAQRALLLGTCVIVGEITGGTVSAQAVGAGSGGSLGGYGAMRGDSMGGSPVIPYAGRFGGFMPYGMGGGSLSFLSRQTAPLGFPRSSFGLSPMTGGTSPVLGARGQGFGAGSGALAPFGSASGMGLGDPMRPRMPAPGGANVMPPHIGYPFYQPPSLVPQ